MIEPTLARSSGSVVMGMGTPSRPNETASDWNMGSCDIMAVALHRQYGLPIFAEFEYGIEDGVEQLNYLIHACVKLPDGRFFDAAGVLADFEPSPGKDDSDPWVQGYRVVEIADDDPHLLEIREEDDYRESIEISGAYRFMERHLDKLLADAGVVKPMTAVEVDRDIFDALEALGAWASEEGPGDDSALALHVDDGIGANSTFVLAGELARIASISEAIDENADFPVSVEIDNMTVLALATLASWIEEHAFDKNQAALGEYNLVSYGELATIAGLATPNAVRVPGR